MTQMENNTLTEEKILPKKKPVKKQVKEKEATPALEAKEEDKILVYFESGTAYVLSSGFRFDKESNRMAEVTVQEATSLLQLQNFRIPSDEEKEFYYNTLEA